MVGLDDGVYLFDAIQVRGPLIIPVGHSRDTQGRYLVVPERVAVALSLYQHDEASRTCLVEESKPVGRRLVGTIVGAGTPNRTVESLE